MDPPLKANVLRFVLFKNIFVFLSIFCGNFLIVVMLILILIIIYLELSKLENTIQEMSLTSHCAIKPCTTNQPTIQENTLVIYIS